MAGKSDRRNPGRMRGRLRSPLSWMKGIVERNWRRSTEHWLFNFGGERNSVHLFSHIYLPELYREEIGVQYDDKDFNLEMPRDESFSRASSS